MSDALRTTAENYLAALAEGTDIPDGVMFREQLTEVCRDGTLPGLHAVDALLDEVAALADVVWDEPTFHTMAFCLGFHVARVLVAETGTAIEYLTREELAERMPGLDLDELALAFAIATDAGLHLPLHAVVSRLRGQGGSVWHAAACRVRDIRRAHGQAAEDPIDPDSGEFFGMVEVLKTPLPTPAPRTLVTGTPGLADTLDGYLAALVGGRPLPDGIAYHDKIDTARLDGSPASLRYIDQILLRLHQAGLRVAVLGARADFANLVRALGAYCVQAIGVELGMRLPVLSYADFRALHPQQAALVPNDLGAEFVLCGVRPGHVMFPLAAVTSRIDHGSRASVHDAVERQIALLRRDLTPGSATI